MQGVPWTVNLFGPEPREAEALTVPVAQVVYDWPGSALSASAQLVDLGINLRVERAWWELVWTPNAVGCGVELVRFEAGPVNIQQVAEFTGSAAVTPQSNLTDVTAALRTLVQEARLAKAQRNLGYRVKANGAVSPVIYQVRLDVLFGHPQKVP